MGKGHQTTSGKGHHSSYRTGQSLAVDAQTKGLDNKADKGRDSKGNKEKK